MLFRDEKYEHDEINSYCVARKKILMTRLEFIWSLCFLLFRFNQAFEKRSTCAYGCMHRWEYTSHYSERHTMGATVRAIRSRNNHRPSRRTVLGEFIVVESWCSIRMSIMQTRGSTHAAYHPLCLEARKYYLSLRTSCRPGLEGFVESSFIFSRRNEDSGEDRPLEEHRG